MNEPIDQISCPYCSTQMKREIVSVNSGSSWHDDEPKGIRRLLWAYFGSNAPAFKAQKAAASDSARHGLKCPSCSTIVVPGGGA